MTPGDAKGRIESFFRRVIAALLFTARIADAYPAP